MNKRNKGIQINQIAEFTKAARELGCDESEASFDRALGKVANAPPGKPARASKKQQLTPPKKKIKFNLPGA
jgi:hypothetical protein